MIINKKSAGTLAFRSIPFGSVFVEVGSEEVFMKLDTTYDIDREDYNAVSLREGQLVHFGETEQIILPKNPELLVEY